MWQWWWCRMMWCKYCTRISAPDTQRMHVCVPALTNVEYIIRRILLGGKLSEWVGSTEGKSCMLHNFFFASRSRRLSNKFHSKIFANIPEKMNRVPFRKIVFSSRLISLFHLSAKRKCPSADLPSFISLQLLRPMSNWNSFYHVLSQFG